MNYAGRATIAGVVLLTLGGLSSSALAQSPEKRFDLSGSASYGTLRTEENSKADVSAFGASLSWRAHTIHGLQLDYMFIDVKGWRRDRHWVTGSYVVQSRTGRVRPFFQVGFGGGVESQTYQSIVPGVMKSATVGFVGPVIGAGVTVDVRESFFIRPKFNCYLFGAAGGGPDRVYLPGVAVGWRF